MRTIRFAAIVWVCLFTSKWVYSQCTNGNQPECTCETAPVLCTIDELDGYMFGMASYQHPWDGPSPLCTGSPNSIPNNPTWFAFQAWCTTIELNVSFDNCVPVGGTIGVQIAVYADCATYEEVSCNVAVSDCNTNDKNLVISGMEIGNTYYFLVDGCLGSHCNVTIDVLGTCGEEMIEDWTAPVMGETIACAGVPEGYSVEDLVGANTFHWFIDGVEVAQTGDPNYTITWDNAGVYELCVDASSDPCIPVTDPPDPNCITIEVFAPEAGEIMANPNPLCPDEISDLTASGFTVDPGIIQAILVVDASGTIVQVTPGSTATFTHNECAEFMVYSYNFLSANGETLPSVGDPFSSINCGPDCCEVEGEPLIFEDTEAPVFLNPPADFSVECLDELPPGQGLDWQDNCDGSGQVSPTEQNIPDPCTGGTMQRRWEYTDLCGNTEFYIQVITVSALPEPEFDNPPPDMTVDCNSIPPPATDLLYSNNSGGACLIEGLVPPNIAGTADLCGGVITNTWEYTDICNRTIFHSQTITVIPADDPAFVNPPADVTVDCDNIPTTAPDLNYTNGMTGNCLIEGTVSPVISGNGDICGGGIQFTWEQTDQCGRTISHNQTFTITPIEEATFINPPVDITVTCDNIPVSAPDLTYSNGSTGDCLIEGTVPAVMSGSGTMCGGDIQFTWSFTDQCNRTITHVQTFTIEPVTPPAFLNPPADLSVTCANIPVGAPDLIYSNGGAGNCLIEGTVPAVLNGTPDGCGADFAFTWQFTDPCGNMVSHIQNIFVDPAPEPVFDSLPGDLTVPCVHDPGLLMYDLGFNNGGSGMCAITGAVAPVLSGSFNECGGTLTTTWTYTDPCGRTITHARNATVEPSAQAMFTSMPADITVDCADAGSLNTILGYSNGESGACVIAGTVTAVQTGSYSGCGGVIQLQWTFTDNCGRTISHTQGVTVLPASAPVFLNPPGDATLECDQVPAVPPSLSFSNGATGNCLISGSVIAIQSGSYDACGGSISYTWTNQDPCGNVISHIQSVEVLPAPDPVFFNPPDDLTLSCGESVPPPVDLTYGNSMAGNCENSGSEEAETEINGYVTTYTWSFTNPCNNNTITHSQVITESVAPELEISPVEVELCLGETYDLTAIEVFDLNETDPVLTYHDGSPAGPGNVLNSTTVTPGLSTTYYILGSNTQGCMDEIPFEVTVEEPPNAGEDGEGTVCHENTLVDLFDFIGGFPDPDGEWYDISGSGVNLSNPTGVNFFNIDPGIYEFLYVVFPENVCPADSSLITIELLEDPEITIDSIGCTQTGQFYHIILNANGYTINSSAGEVIDLGGNLIEIADIPIDQAVTITIEDLENFCLEFITVQPPDCDCPSVPLPTNNGNQEICEGESVPELSVSVPAGMTANWFADAGGTTLLIGESLTYTPVASSPGIYTFYVETLDPLTLCVSTQLVPVRLTIYANPAANDTILEGCDDNNDGLSAFDLSVAQPLISTNSNHGFAFFETQSDAESNTNALPINFNNTTPYQQTLFVRVTDQNGCWSIVMLELFVHDMPEAEIAISDEICFGENNGIAEILSFNHPSETSLDQVSWSNALIYDSLAPGMYSLHLLDSNGCSNTDPFAIEEGLELTISGITQTCNNNGTQSDSTDDFYELAFTVIHQLGNTGQFTVDESGNVLGQFNYGEQIIIEFDALGQTVSLSFTDNTTGCSVSQSFGPLTSCSTDCLISFITLEYTCNNNGTESDPSDDFYEVIIEATVLNGGPNNMYNVLIDGNIMYSFMYDEPNTFQLMPSVNPVNITIVDNAISACSATQIIGPLQPCSNQCSIDVSISNIQCDDGGTTETSSDDIFYFDMTVTGVNVSGTWFETGLSISGAYNTTTTLGPFLIADGIVQISVSDGSNPNCLIQTLINPPAPCSDPCEIALQSLETSDCNDFGTGPDQDDDIFSVTLIVSVTSGSATTFTVSDGNRQWGPFDYNVPVIIDSLPANGSTLQLEVVDVSNPNCHLIIEVSQDPCSTCDQTIGVGGSQTITCDQNTVDLAISASEVPILFSWMGPNAFSSTLQNVTVSAPGWYFATVVFPDQCIARDSVQIFIDDDVPSVNAGPNMFLSCDTDLVLLDGGLSSSGPDIVYTWTDSEGNVLSNDLQLQVDSAGTYYFSLLDTVTQCASGVDEVVVTDSTDLPSAVIYAHPQDVVNCLIQSITLSPEEVANAIYLWLYGNQDPVIAGQITVSDPGVYQLQVIDTITGCLNRDSIIITDLTEYPFLTIDDYNPIDCSNLTVTLDASGSQQGPGIILSWYNENQQLLSNDVMIDVTEPGNYFIELLDTLNGCSSYDTVFVEDISNAPEIDAGSDLRLPCGESDTDLDAIGSNYPPNAMIQWTSPNGTILSGGNTFTPHVEGEGWYVLDVFNPDNNCRSVDSVFVNVIDDIPGVFGLSVDSIDCHNASTGQILLNNIEGGTPPYDITLNGQNVSGQSEFLSLGSGSYNLELTDANGCVLDTTIVLENPAPINITLDPVIELLYNETGLIEAIVSIPAGEIANIEWLPPDYLSCDSCLVTEIIAVDEGEYLLTITDIHGCMETATLRLLIRSEHNAFIPNVFSPNGDGINDRFTVFGDENLMRINTMRLYDRWGEIVFERLDFAANDPSLGWDGTFRNELMLPGVYVYAIELLFVDGKTEIVKGDVTLVR